MGFFFRKSVSFGPFRLNFSKSGIGVSAGVKGARISTGPRGTYVHAGRKGFYYSQRIGQSHVHVAPAKPKQWVNETSPFIPRDFVIETADVSKLTETSINELLNQINERSSQMRFAPWAIAATIAGAIIMWISVFAVVGALAGQGQPNKESAEGLATFASLIAAIAVGVAGSVLSYRIHKGDELKRTTPLFYELEQEAAAKFEVVQNACKALSRSARIWRVYTDQPTWDWKRNAGASSLITRRPAFVGRQSPHYIATNVDVWSLRLGDIDLSFMPDYVFVRQQGLYGAVSYDSLVVSSSPTRFIEDGGVPPDAQVIDYTWRFVNKKGGPDRRFSNNRQLPIAQYGFVQLESNTGLNIHLHVSNLSAATEFSNSFFRGRSHAGRQQQYEEPKRETKQRPTVDPKIRSAYEILGVSVTASADEIVSAYRSMAKMYHPDRLVNMAPEFVELAEERMKEINAAYERLKRR